MRQSVYGHVYTLRKWMEDGNEKGKFPGFGRGMS